MSFRCFGVTLPLFRSQLTCCTALVSLAMYAVGSVDFAQALPAPSPSTPPTASATIAPRSSAIETVVTARRKSENVQKVPVAESVLLGAAINQQKIVAPEDLNSKVPSLSVAFDSTTRDSSVYTIGGQGEQFAGSEPAVITYFDEVPTNTADAGVELFAVNTDPKTSGVPITLYYPGIVGALAKQLALGPRKTAHDLQDGYTRIRSLGINNTTTVHVTDDILLKTIFGYRDFLHANAQDVDGTIFPIVQNFANSYQGAGFTSEPSTRSFTEEFQVQGKSFANRLSWFASVYVEYQKPGEGDDQDQFTQFAQSEATILNSTYVYQSLKQDRSRAIFRQCTYDFLDFVPKLKFTGGVRYTEDGRLQIALNYPIALSCEGAAAAGTSYCNEYLTAPYHAPTGTVSLDYQITPKILLYVASRHGYKSGGST